MTAINANHRCKAPLYWVRALAIATIVIAHANPAMAQTSQQGAFPTERFANPYGAPLSGTPTQAPLPSAPLGAPPQVPSNMQIQQVQLSPDLIQRFMASTPEMKVLSERIEAEQDALPAGAQDDPFNAMAGLFQVQRYRNQVMSVIGKHGFTSPIEWVQTAFSSQIALMALEDGSTLRDQMNEALAELDASDLPEAQKEMLRQQFASQVGFIQDFTTPLPGNVEAVTPFADTLRQTLDAM